MKEFFHIKEVSEIFSVPCATLRYWQSEGLFHVSRQANGYRQFTAEDLIILSDIIYYRELNLPIKQIKNLIQKAPEELEKTLLHSEKKLEEQIQTLKIAQEKTKKRRSFIQHAGYLLKHPYQKSVPPIKRIIDFDFGTPAKTKYYLSDPSRYIQVYQDPNNLTPLHGLSLVCSDDFPKETVIWKQNPQSKNFYNCIIKVSFDLKTNTLSEHLNYLKQNKKQARTVLAQYLFSGCEDQYYDYYEGWIEVKE